MCSIEFPDHLAPSLRQLRQAQRYSTELETEPWDFAVELEELKATGGTLTDLRWLIAKGWVEHREELTQPGDNGRTFRPLSPTDFPQRTCLVLTPTGCETIDNVLSAGADTGSPPALLPNGSGPGDSLLSPGGAPSEGNVTPVVTAIPPATVSERPQWDPNLRELHFHGQLIKRYRVPAFCQEQILNAFQEEGWPEWINDPLPPTPTIDAKRRLASTIKALNRRQNRMLLRFHGNGDGGTILWRPAAALVPRGTGRKPTTP